MLRDYNPVGVREEHEGHEEHEEERIFFRDGSCRERAGEHHCVLLRLGDNAPLVLRGETVFGLKAMPILPHNNLKEAEKSMPSFFRILTCHSLGFLMLVLAACEPPAPAPAQQGPQSAGPTSADPLTVEDYVAQAKAAGMEVEVHRVGAGVFDPTGWILATSTGGGFSVSVPTAFNDITLIGGSEDGVEMTTHLVGTRDERQVKFMAVAMIRADGKFKTLDEFASGFKSNELELKRSVSLGDMRGIEVRVANRSSSAAFRLYLSKTKQYLLTVEAPASIKPAEVDDDIQRFMDSFVPPKDQP